MGLSYLKLPKHMEGKNSHCRKATTTSSMFLASMLHSSVYAPSSTRKTSRKERSLSEYFLFIRWKLATFRVYYK